jgi:hypothetical protein
MVDVIHAKFQHASTNEMKNIIKLNVEEFKEVSATNIDNWYQEHGRFCSGCAEGKMKEHARIKSTKPLQSLTPGSVTVGDIMFVKLKEDTKKPLMVHVNVYTKLITGIPLRNRSEEECTKAIVDIKAHYLLND